MHGFLALDKPEGISSHALVQKVRRACGVRRVGHAGTLDPLATGVVLVGVGHATRLLEYLVAQGKSYRATMRLGVTTDSQDITGNVLQRTEVTAITLAQICSVCRKYTGDIEQVPPMFSALKHNGVPLYRLARKGEEIERQKRPVHIRSIEVISYSDVDVVLEVDCSKGTYIRTLCHDIGQELGCGACMLELRRTGSGLFTEQDLHTVEDLETGAFELISPLEGLKYMQRVELSEEGCERLRDGIPPCSAHISVPHPHMWTAPHVLLSHADRLMAVARPDPEHLEEERGEFKLLKVFPAGI